MTRGKINTNIHLDSGFGCIIMEETNKDYTTNMSVCLIFTSLLLSLFFPSLSFKNTQLQYVLYSISY